MSTNFTLHDLQCFDAVLRLGGFQAAAAQLHRSHPAVFAAVARLERQLDLSLLDRSGYRVRPTEAGRAFHQHALVVLREAELLGAHAQQLAMGVESELRVVLGDFCPRAPLLQTLGRFFAARPTTQLRMDVESVGGPLERLHDGEADLVVHAVRSGETNIECLELGEVLFVPVVAPGFLPFPSDAALTPQRLRGLAQCVIRGSARHTPQADFNLIEGAPRCTVPDQAMKKELILHGIAWGHMPHFLIEAELREGSLLSIAGPRLPGHTEMLVAVRRSDRPHGPVAEALWDTLRSAAPQLRAWLDARNPCSVRSKSVRPRSASKKRPPKAGTRRGTNRRGSGGRA